jgi:hypothetical protein
MNELSDDERNLLRYYAETHHQCEMPSTSYLACQRIHLVNPTTGEVLGDDE